jgi:ClpP class serine protease
MQACSALLARSHVIAAATQVQQFRTCAASFLAGADALAHGLVDKLGGLQDAVVLARQEAKLSEEVCTGADAVLTSIPPVCGHSMHRHIARCPYIMN